MSDSIKPKRPGTNKKIWTFDEETKLVETLLELHNTERFKAERGFKPGHFNAVEDSLKEKLPNCGIKAKPHIESKVRSLRANFGVVHDMLAGCNCSGFGWDSDRKCITAENAVWDEYLKSHPDAEPFRFKSFPFYEELCIVFGKDRATGKDAETAADIVEELDKQMTNEVNENEVLNDEMFAILVLMALFTTFMTTPAVMAIYKPSRRIFRGESTTENSGEKTRILACIHGPANVPALANLIESTRSSKRSSLKLYVIVMRLIELTDRSSSTVMVQRTRKNGFPFIKRFSQGGSSNDEMAAAFEAYGHVTQLTIRHSTSISALSTMHEDICHLAQSKRVSMIILLFQKPWREDENGWRHVNQKVFDNAPCSVAILVDRQDRTAATRTTTSIPERVCVVFCGGANDRQAMEVGGWMAENPAIAVSVIRFYEQSSNNFTDKERDEEAVEKFRSKWNGRVEYIENHVDNIEEEVVNIGRYKGFDLLIVGKRGSVCDPAEHSELGLIGGVLASSEYCRAASVLVIQDNPSTNSADPKLLPHKEPTNTNTSVIK